MGVTAFRVITVTRAEGPRGSENSSEPGQGQCQKESLCLQKERAGPKGEAGEPGGFAPGSQASQFTLGAQGRREESAARATEGREDRVTRHLLPEGEKRTLDNTSKTTLW